MSASRALAIVSASAAIGTLIPVALFQCGMIDKLPDPPGKWFASERITSSDDAHPIGVPDSLPGLASYGATLALLLASGNSDIARWLFRRKLMLDGGMASFNVVKQVVKFRALCSWCTGTALATAGLYFAGRSYSRRLQREP